MSFSSWLRNWQRPALRCAGAHKRPLANGRASTHGWKSSKAATCPAR